MIASNFAEISLVLLLCIKCYSTESEICDKIIIKQGVLSGTVEHTFVNKKKYYSFQGIPYAIPPLGELRFQPPKPLENWEGIYEAHTNKPTCVQGNARMRNNERNGVSGLEDCLYLNVHTPSFGSFLPVIVFDYNDNFRTGFNGSQTYSPDFFIEEDVIIVTINHRLGLLGYLTTEDDVIPRNSGLKDFILGLQWVQDNIEKFGGDPERVTLLGNRGGAVLAEMLLYSEQAKGLFSAVALHSGSSFESIFFPENPRKSAFQLAKSLSVETEDSKVLLEELQKIGSFDLVVNEHHAFDSESAFSRQMDIYPFSPVIEPEENASVLMSKPEDAKVVNDVPVLRGLNSREGLDLIHHFLFDLTLITQIREFLFHFPIRSSFSFDRNSTIYDEAIEEIRNFYLKDGYFHVKNILEYAVYVGDIIQMYASDYAVEMLMQKVKSPIYYYVFDYRGSINENSIHLSRHSTKVLQNWGATITDELCYLFICSRIRKNYEELYNLATEQTEQKLIKKMVRMWANFAKTRNPTPEGDVVLKGIHWEPVDHTAMDKKYLHISKKITMKTNPLGDRKEFWDRFLAKYAEKARDGVVKDAEKATVRVVKDVDKAIDEIVKDAVIQAASVMEDAAEEVSEDVIRESEKRVEL